MDLWANALQADQLAYSLQNEASRTTLADRPRFTRLSSEAADMFEVAADAWEERGDPIRAQIRRDSARYNRLQAFEASHDYLGDGMHAITDAEAEELARRKRCSSSEEVAIEGGVECGPLKDIPRAFFTWRLKDRLGSVTTRRPWIWAIYGVR